MKHRRVPVGQDMIDGRPGVLMASNLELVGFKSKESMTAVCCWCKKCIAKPGRYSADPCVACHI